MTRGKLNHLELWNIFVQPKNVYLILYWLYL